MKKLLVIACVLAAVMGLAGGASAADNSLKQGTFGVSVGFDNNSQFDFFTISGRYLIQNDLAAILELGLRDQGGNQSGHFFSLGLGVRKYFRTSDFSPFVEGRLKIESQDIQGDTDTLELGANVGAEYFLHKQFSIEASVGVAVGKVDDNTVANNDYTYLTTHVIGVRANFYF